MTTTLSAADATARYSRATGTEYQLIGPLTGGETGAQKHAKELAECGNSAMPRTQDEMRRLLDGDAVATQAPTQQMDFAL